MAIAYHDWVEALAGAGKKPKPRDNGASHMALCPAHDDTNPSLSISHGDKADVVVKCFTGCTFDQIRTSLFGTNGASDSGVTRQPSSVPAVTASTPPKPQALPSGPDIQHWTYCDKDGQVVFQVVRSPGKRFSQWTPVAAGLYISRGPTGLKPLYFLPDILKSTGTVAIVEGEKCADAARAAWPTQVVTTWAGGALNWAKTDWTPLKGREVSLLADADPVDEKLGFRPGHEGMLGLAEHLLVMGCKVAIGLPMDSDGSDVEDWIKRDGSAAAAARLKELKEDYPLQEPAPLNQYEERVLEYRNPQSTSEFAFVYRFLSYAPEWFLVATTDDERPAALYLLQDKLGVWTRSIDRIGIVWKESIDEWLAVFGKAASESQLAKADIDNVIKATRRMKSAAGLKASLKCVGTVALDMKRRDSKSLLTICDRRRLDENPQYVGTQSGVFDLDTGLVLAPTDGRLTLVTRTIPTAVDMDARHPFVDSLMDRLPNEEREFMLDAIAYAARRKPSRRIYFVVGPPGGGKSTLANALLATVGWVGDRGYGVVVDSSGIITGGKMRTKNAHHGALIGMQEAMFAIVPELPPGI